MKFKQNFIVNDEIDWNLNLMKTIWNGFFQIVKEFELIREVTEEDIEGYVEKTRMLLTNLFENSDAMTEVNIQKYIWI